MTARLNARLANVTVMAPISSPERRPLSDVHLVGVSVVVRHNNGRNEGRITVDGAAAYEMEVESVTPMAGKLQKVTGVDGSVWLVAVRCRPCGG